MNNKTTHDKDDDKKEDDKKEDDKRSKQQPVLELTEAYHPILPDEQTKHTLTLDKHIVLTGSNASGKSTVLKTMLLTVLLAQSWGPSHMLA